MEFEGDAVSRRIGSALSRFDAIPKEDTAENSGLTEVDPKFGQCSPGKSRGQYLTRSGLWVGFIEGFSWEKGGGSDNQGGFAVAVGRFAEREAITPAETE